MTGAEATGRAPALEGWTPVPDDFAARYRERGHWERKPLGRHLDEWAERSGEAVAVTDQGGESVSYAELATRSRRLAGALRDELGLRSHDRVLVQLPNLIEFIEFNFALFRIGALPIMALPPHREHETSHMAEIGAAVAHAVPDSFKGYDYVALARSIAASSSTVRHVLVAGRAEEDGVTSLAALRDGADEADLAEPDAAQPALFLLSGGTTGLPKLIPRTHEDYAYNFSVSSEICAMDSETVYLVALPIAHNFPLGCPGFLGAMHAGGRAALTLDPSPGEALPVVERERVTHTALVPGLSLGWADAAARDWHDLSSLRLVQVGGARLAAEAARKVRPALGCQLQQVFGMAEGLLNYTRPGDPDDVVFETQGRPASPDDELRIVDSDGRPVPDGDPGELETRGPYTIRGYYRAEEHNSTAFSPDGFYRSGDVVRLHPSGNLTVEGRVKDLINRGGEKISAEEIENLILAHPKVFNVAAVAMPDPRLGERTCVYVVPREGEEMTLAELVEFLAGRGIAKFKLPERLEPVGELPLTSVGKVDKQALRDDVATKLRDAGASL